MKLHLLIPALLGVLLLSGCVVEEPYATRGRYYDRGPSYHDTVYVEGRSYPRSHSYNDRSYSRGYDRSDYRSHDRSYDRGNNNRSYDRGSNDRSYSHGNYERSRTNVQVKSYNAGRNSQRPSVVPVVGYHSQQRPDSVKGQHKGSKKEKNNRD
ncbi:MAG: hypothetical protein JWL90_3657 [Chthoniobacteraceae bacterium]|nr:hypothetical protein [Chthoniobacteraceae bacterium]